MTTQIIYDETGYILSIRQGSFGTREPIGVPFLNVEVPENAFPDKVNVDGEVHFVEYKQHPKSDSDLLRAELEDAILELTMLIYGGGL